ncbi:MAG TPA: DUF72 domain-containing protein [Candidatus Tectomicrobia bacterium]|jgi:uncharacterized protein YecE (DUF72 family)|nr:DUF72 domain-containing protein [Candidatus Tectomicrobia bacterium]
MSPHGKPGRLRVGTSGYQYEHWRGLFYPKPLPKKAWFAYYADHFDTVEINNTFYRLPQPATFEAWQARAPAGFCYAVKFSRYGSHLKRLKDPGEPVARFLDRADRLRPFLGPILVQLPPNWKPDVERLSGFLKQAPRHYRWAFEFRDHRWLCAEVFELLRHANAALCIHDLIVPHPREITADWLYLRFHGTSSGGNYTDQALRAEASRIRQYVATGLDVFAYFNNDVGGHALHNAADLRRYAQVGGATRA